MGEAISEDVGLDVGRDPIMARVCAVLDPSGTGQITQAQRRLFEMTCSHIVEFNMDRKNPIVSVIHHIGNYWRNWLLVILHTGTYRPSKIAKLLEAVDPSHPISQRMLTLNLRLLERDGLVKRTVIRDRFTHVEYSLTCLGEQLAEQMMAIIDWIGDHAKDITDARMHFDAGDEYC